jgi:hypothetical protein
MKFTVFWAVTWYSLVDTYECFKGYASSIFRVKIRNEIENGGRFL